MSGKAVVTCLCFLFASSLATANAVELQPSVEERSEKREKVERSRDYACDCCQKCKAARRPVRPKQEEGTLESNGCKDCCERCGKVLPPAPEEIPPEIIQKQVPPEVKDKRAPEVKVKKSSPDSNDQKRETPPKKR